MAIQSKPVLAKCDICSKNITEHNDAKRIIAPQGNVICCMSCYVEYAVACVGCGTTYTMEHQHIDLHMYRRDAQWLCNGCWDRINRTIKHRDYAHGYVVGAGEGKAIQSPRGWSCEIECYITDVPEAVDQFAKLPNTFGIGRDGSLVNNGQATQDGRELMVGVELTTPILKGVDGEKYLKGLCRALNYKDNARVDSTCGLHLHIDATDLMQNSYEGLQRLLVFHWLYEPVIMSFLPANRRANTYCQSLKNDYHYKKILEAKDLRTVKALWYKDRAHLNRYDKKHPRYHGINVHSLFEANNVEIRYHSGTTNARKIIYWASLHTRIIDYCLNQWKKPCNIHKIVDENLTITGRCKSLGRLTANMLADLELPEEVQKYFMERQLKFKNAKATMEVDFVEKEAIEPLDDQNEIAEQNFAVMREGLQAVPQNNTWEDTPTLVPGMIGTQRLEVIGRAMRQREIIEERERRNLEAVAEMARDMERRLLQRADTIRRDPRQNEITMDELLANNQEV